MKTIAKQYQEALEASRKCQRHRSARKKKLTTKVYNLLHRQLKLEIRRAA